MSRVGGGPIIYKQISFTLSRNQNFRFASAGQLLLMRIVTVTTAWLTIDFKNGIGQLYDMFNCNIYIIVYMIVLITLLSSR